jgi:uncharacterized protein YbjQ (UPF0145 family)
MRISFTEHLDGNQTYTPIGRIKAATGWHATGVAPQSGDWKEEALRRLIRTAEDFEADAIIGVNYQVDGVQGRDLEGVELERVAATGLAVKLARA